MNDLSLKHYQKIGKKKIWCYSFNLSTSPKRRRLQYTYFGTVQTFNEINYLWANKRRKIELLGLHHRRGKINLLETGKTKGF
jgi:hypothetical protein